MGGDLMEKQYLSVNEVAALTGFSKFTIYVKLERSEMPGKRVFGRWRVDKEELNSFMSGTKNEG
jgi:excisionase family DNA binding protein